MYIYYIYIRDFRGLIREHFFRCKIKYIKISETFICVYKLLAFLSCQNVENNFLLVFQQLLILPKFLL